MDNLFKEVSDAQNTRIIEESNKKKRQHELDKKAEQDTFNNLIQGEMDSVMKQISSRKSNRIIIFDLSFGLTDEVKLVVLNRIIKTFESNALIHPLSYDGKWASSDYYYYYNTLGSQLQTMPKNRNITICKYAIEFNANSNKLFPEKSGSIDGKIIELFEK